MSGSVAQLTAYSLQPTAQNGIVTVVFPFILMQPSFGLGIAGSKTPHPARARMKSLMTHTVFGVGLYLSGLGMSQLVQAP